MASFCKKTLNRAFLALCRPFNSKEVSVTPSTPAQERDYYKYEQVGPSGLSLHSENFLRSNLIWKKLQHSPRQILSTIDDFYKISGDPVYRLIAADVCHYLSRQNEAEAIRYHLAAFHYCYQAFSQKKTENEIRGEVENCSFLTQEMQIVNEAIAAIFSHLKKNDLIDSDGFSLTAADDSVFVFEKPLFLLSLPRETVSEFLLCSSVNVKALRLINRRGGIGVPLTAKITAHGKSGALQTPPGLTIPVTFFVRIRPRAKGIFSIIPVYQDTYLSEIYSVDEECIGRGDWKLALDFSTPLACFMNDATQRNLLSMMLNPVKYDEKAGLYMIEPCRPDKIPVVFIHGLMSSPETWGQMINSLKYDPAIRRKYQFWFFSYSTGMPVLYSASKLCHALLNTQKEFCTTPEAVRNFEKMVLVGHSMGGLLTRLLLQKNSYQMLEMLCGQPWQEIRQKLQPEDWQLIRKVAILEPLDFVKRAVFMAVPHKGSAVAKKKIAHLGIRLIHLPKTLLSQKESLSRIWKTIMPKEKAFWRKDSFITGIDNLDPDSIFVRWAGSAPLREDVIFHSIIGNRREASTPGGSDGIVPYASSHIDGVASECIVKSDHSVHRNPAAIRELLRILLLHDPEKE